MKSEIRTQGFLSMAGSLDEIPDEFKQYDKLAKSLPHSISDGSLCEQVASLPYINTDNLNTLQLERLKSATTFIVQAYVWFPTFRGSRPNQVIPEALSDTLVRVSRLLDEPAIFNYSDDILRNWFKTHDGASMKIGDLDVNYTFSGTQDEKNFNLVHVMYEHTAISAINSIFLAQEAALMRDKEQFMLNMIKLKSSIFEMKQVFLMVKDTVSPDVFKRKIRQFLMGWHNTIEIVYSGQDVETDLRGETGAQSSVLPFIDRSLGISNNLANTQKESFGSIYSDWINYMPKPHREIIYESSPNVIREFSSSFERDGAKIVRECVEVVAAMRRAHFATIIPYIRDSDDVSDGNTLGTGGTDYRSYLSHTVNSTEI